VKDSSAELRRNRAHNEMIISWLKRHNYYINGLVYALNETIIETIKQAAMSEYLSLRLRHIAGQAMPTHRAPAERR
jgi:hypothetical protein